MEEPTEHDSLAACAACGLAFLRHASTKGERRSFRQFGRAGCPLFPPLAIPELTPRRWRTREQAIVF